jgi:drug/metabolite transporter (DMT)-like permease
MNNPGIYGLSHAGGERTARPGVRPYRRSLPVPSPLYRYRYELALLATVVIWGANVPFLKIALREVSTAEANAIRFTFGTVALGLFAHGELRRTGRSFGAVLRRHGWALAALGLIGYFLYQEAFIFSLSITSSASAALLMATSPLWTALFSHFSGLQRLRGSSWGGLLLALSGAALVASARHSTGHDSALGNGVMLLAALAWSVFTTLNGRMKRLVPPGTSAFAGMLVALPCLYLVSALTPGWQPLTSLSAATWLTLFFSGSLSVGLTFAVWNAAIAHVGPTTTAAFGYLSPLVAALVGFVLLGEPITLYHVLGGALLLGGLVWMRRGLRTPDEEAVEAVA